MSNEKSSQKRECLNTNLRKSKGIVQKSMAFQEIKFQETDIYIRSSISFAGIPCYFLMAK